MATRILGRYVEATGALELYREDTGAVVLKVDENGLDATLGTADIADGAITAVKLAADSVLTAKILDANVTEAKLAAQILDGAKLKNTAEAAVIGGIPVVHAIDIPDAATGDVDVVLTHKTRVLEVIVVKTAGAGAAGNLITVKNGATAITDAIDTNIADKAVKRNAEIDDAQHEIAAAGTLRVTRTKAGGNAACKVYVFGMRVA